MIDGNGGPPGIEIPDSLLDHLATMIADRLAERLAPPKEPYMNSQEAAEYLGFKGRTFSKKMSELAESGRVATYRDGNRLLFRREDLDEYVAAPPDRFR